MQHLISTFVEHLKARNVRTAALYGAILTKLYTAGPGGIEVELNRAALDAFLDRPRLDGQPRRATTVNQEIAGLRAFSKFMEKRGAPPLPVGDIEFRKEPRRDPVFLTEDELALWFIATASEADAWRQARNLALVATSMQAGLRVSEIANINVDQVDLRGLELVAVRGKGSTVRTVKINTETAALLSAWIGVRASTDGDASALFRSRAGRRIHVREIERLFVKLRATCKTLKKVTPHSGRHTLGTQLLLRGAAFDVVASVLGHSSLETSRLYSHLVDVRVRVAIDGLGTIVPREVLPVPRTESLPVGAASVTKNVPANDTHTLDGQHGLFDEAALDTRQERTGRAA